MSKAFFQYLHMSSQASALEQHEFAQLIEDIHRYHQEYKNGQLSRPDAQELINDAIDDAQSTIATARGMREDSVRAATNAALQVLQKAIETTLSAAFTGFVFAL
jgi:hypothetical protein